MNALDASRSERARQAALEAAAALPGPDPVPTITYHSAGKTLIVGSAAEVAPLADALCGQLDLTVLLTDPAPRGALEPLRPYLVRRAHSVRIRGYLGAFDVAWQADSGAGEARVDLVLDLSPSPLMAQHQAPPGYFAPGAEPAERALAVQRLADMIGEFEKPKYFNYKERLCAHSRNRQVGCNACIDICSARAIEGAGERIKVTAQLCAGCGACSTVCPSGALAYAYPDARYTGARLRTLIHTYRASGCGAPVLLFHSGEHGKALIGALELGVLKLGALELGALKLGARESDAPGVPAEVIPVELEHAASVGIEVWLAALAYGAGAVRVLMTDEEAPQYRSAIAAQMAIANAILNGLGYLGEHCQLLQVTAPAQLGAALALPVDGINMAEAGTFHLMADKRNSLDLVLSHLVRHAPLKPDYVPLPAGAPFGAVRVDTTACSLCMACVGACPSSALMDSPTAPQLRFVEKNCVQCGLCAATCPENAIVLEPRMAFADTWNSAVVLHESTPFCCIRCSKPFGTLQMIENMLGKLGAHPAFAGNLERLRMCGDCRVIDMMKSGDSARVSGQHRQ